MAGPIKISVLADVGQAVKSVTHFSDVVDEETKRVVTSLGDSKLTGGFGKLQEGFDVADTRAMGFRDTITGVQDTMTGFQGLLGDRKPTQTFADSLFQLGMGVGDLASGFANFIVPMAAVASSMNAGTLATVRSSIAFAVQKIGMLSSAVAYGALTAAQWALNVAMSANPIGLIILAIVLLVGAIVIAYKKSETFRNIVNALGRTFLSVVGNVRAFVSGAIRYVSQLPGKIMGIFGKLKGNLGDIGRDMVSGFLNGIEGAWHFVTDKVNWLVNLIPESVRSLLGINSPSKVFKKIGAGVGEGMALGIKGSQSDVLSATRGLVNIPSSLSGSSSSTSGSGARLTVDTAGNGNRMDDFLAEIISKYVRVNGGGSVQKAFGR